ncbi:hypothetical protein BDZ97DRAFT_1751513 [Flammula alnicola]|nr:hypothetical protein BDZ97DRAFT_1751513 [Flammula alnicola]
MMTKAMQEVKRMQEAKCIRTREDHAKKKNMFNGLDDLDKAKPTTNVLTMRHSGAPLATVNGDSPWCSGCQNGAVVSEDTDFVCPVCHLFAFEKGSLYNKDPYGMASEYTLAEMANLHLHPYLLGNLVFLDLDFNILAEEDHAFFVEWQAFEFVKKVTPLLYPRLFVQKPPRKIQI